MFVPVACNRCGKPFQVPDADAGKTVACPWCHTTVPTLPVASAARTPAEPLSLDDDPPARPAAPRRHTGPPTAVIVLGVTLLVLLVALGIGLLGYRGGRVPDSAWQAYTPPDNSFTIDFPGEPAAETLSPLPGTPVLGGELFIVHGWYSGADTWVGWREVNPVVAPAAAGNTEAWLLYRPAVDAELKRQRERWNGSEPRLRTVKFENPLTVEVEMIAPGGNVVERMIVVSAGPRTRLYFVGMRAKNLAPDSPAVRRLFESFCPAKE
jgi:hypothetical protein